MAEYPDARGIGRSWEFVDRENRQSAVLMVTRCLPSGDWIFVRQYRAAMGAEVIEFPAGLVDAEETVAAAALRELREETGFTGRVVALSPTLSTSPGLTSERARLAQVVVDERLPENRAPRQACAPGEEITVVRLTAGDALGSLERWARDGVIIDSRVWATLTGSSGNREAAGTVKTEGQG
jgi:8-oxo-dGTP pyrophosphatase MutT (NUDIX family)